MEFSRQEYWRGLPFPSPGDLPKPGIKPESPTLQAGPGTNGDPGFEPGASPSPPQVSGRGPHGLERLRSPWTWEAPWGQPYLSQPRKVE